jgi:hypothetical protein
MSQNYEEVELSEDEYEEMLNELYGTVSICGMEFDSGRVLRELDPTAFRCGMADEPQRWKCLGCGEVYEDEDRAAECCPTEDEEVSDMDEKS